MYQYMEIITYINKNKDISVLIVITSEIGKSKKKSNLQLAKAEVLPLITVAPKVFPSASIFHLFLDKASE